MLKKTVLFFIISALFSPIMVQADSWQASSGDKQVAVMELFVAEGCGRCPPAERWVEQLPELGFDLQKLIVLGFHVDYLDQQKGWVDRFAKAKYTARQQQLARLNLYQTVFTPEFFISGEVLHAWEDHGLEVLDFINQFDAEADINLQADKQNDQLKIHTKVSVPGQDNRQYAKLYLALTEDNVISDIRGGDNIGAVFNHQNLVRRWLGPFELEASGKTDIETLVTLDKEWKLHDLSVVAVVQNLNDGFVLQGLAMPLTE